MTDENRENDFIVALLEAGAALHKESEIIKARAPEIIKDGEDIKIGCGFISPKHYGFKIVATEVHFIKVK